MILHSLRFVVFLPHDLLLIVLLLVVVVIIIVVIVILRFFCSRDLGEI